MACINANVMPDFMEIVVSATNALKTNIARRMFYNHKHALPTQAHLETFNVKTFLHVSATRDFTGLQLEFASGVLKTHIVTRISYLNALLHLLHVQALQVLMIAYAHKARV